MSPPGPKPDPDPELDFDGRYRLEQVGGVWRLTGPLFCQDGRAGLEVGGESPELLDKYRDLAALLNAAVDADRRR